MLISKDYLESLSPCKKRFDNYLKHYGNWSGTLEEFLGLPRLTHDDKIWVFFYSIDREKLNLMIADTVERVLHFYENKQPHDDRPRKAIEAVRNSNKDLTYSNSDTLAHVMRDSLYATAQPYIGTNVRAVAYSAALAVRAVILGTYGSFMAVCDNASGAASCRKTEKLEQIKIMKKYARAVLGDE